MALQIAVGGRNCDAVHVDCHRCGALCMQIRDDCHHWMDELLERKKVRRGRGLISDLKKIGGSKAGWKVCAFLMYAVQYNAVKKQFTAYCILYIYCILQWIGIHCILYSKCSGLEQGCSKKLN